MEDTILKHNAKCLEAEMAWLEKVIDTRFRLYFKQDCAFKSIHDVTPPKFGRSSSFYARTVKERDFLFEERVVVALALAPLIQPQLLDVFFVKNSAYDREFTEFGGVKGTHHLFIPTIETALFILGGEKLDQRFASMRLFGSESPLAKEGILTIEESPGNEAPLGQKLGISAELIQAFTTGQISKPDYNSDFPAKHIETQMTWDDVVLDRTVLDQLDEIKAWIQYGEILMQDWGMGRKIAPGYHSLFYGPPGTGKTLTATLLGKSTGRDVYRIDLSAVVSKYIGETEKNLSKIFDRAENKDWILFFDEADALFGKRTSVNDAHDRYANQEVSYLLQRMEAFNGVVILASNMKDSIDEAFSRRFQTIIPFNIPKAAERKKLWEKAFPQQVNLESRINLSKIADEYSMAGAAIMNVVRFSSLMALRRDSKTIKLVDIENGIRREFQKVGRSV